MVFYWFKAISTVVVGAAIWLRIKIENIEHFAHVCNFGDISVIYGDSLIKFSQRWDKIIHFRNHDSMFIKHDEFRSYGIINTITQKFEKFENCWVVVLICRYLQNLLC